MFDASAALSHPPFEPALGLRSAFMQSMLASKRPVQWLWQRQGVSLNQLSTLHMLPTSDEQGHPVQLTGWYTAHPAATSLVILIHGWEGSHDSSYLYGLACTLYQAGHSIFRLNLRDHGSTHHGLNEGMFHSARLTEVMGAVRAAQALVGGALPLHVLGFSLGGNFALRIGLHGPAHGVHPALCVGISPSVNPLSTLQAIDNGPKIIHRYFLDKWHKAMRAKSAAFPGRFDFSPQLALRSFTDITRAFVATQTDFPDLDSYLKQYTLTPGQLMASPTPLAIVTAEDDSVCPAADFAGLQCNASVRHYLVTPLGGHCGFIQNWRLQSWLDPLLVSWLRTTP